MMALPALLLLSATRESRITALLTSSIWMGRAAENKSSVISFQLSVTRAGKAIADSGQLIPNPQPRAPIPQPFPRYLLSIIARAAGPAEAG